MPKSTSQKLSIRTSGQGHGEGLGVLVSRKHGIWRREDGGGFVRDYSS